MSLDDLTLSETLCCECGKPISSIPAWLSTAQVSFQCEECRQKHPRVPGMAEVETRRSPADADDSGGIAPREDAETEEPEDEDTEDASDDPEE